MNVTYTNSITVDEFNYIRSAIGFRQFHPEQVQREIDGSTLMIAAYEKGKIVGMARLIWVGGVSASMFVYIIPDYQMQGIESDMINQILNFITDKLKPGFCIQVDINAFGNNQIELYKNHGFKISTIEQRGVPMHICLTNQIELTDKMYN